MSTGKPAILIATRNAGKLAEFERILGEEFDVEGLGNLEIDLPTEGTESYRENADEKARFVAKQTGRPTLGDDSGIEVRALDNRPGVISARFGGEPISDQRNIDKLLSELDGNGADRSARFVCWLALANSNGLVTSVEGVCQGSIGFAPRGTNGFGYDPIFLFQDGRSMAELTDDEKDAISHRGNAIRAMLPELRRVVEGNDNA